MKMRDPRQATNLYRVAYSQECEREIRELHAYITLEKSYRVATQYIRRLKTFCKSMAIAPHRGEHRPGLAEQQRTIGFEGRISIVFRVYDEQKLVRITGIRYGGRSLDQNE
jgi:plasmid stabilization system protein ParE